LAERWRDHAPDAESGHRPDRHLAGTAAAEILAGDEDLRVAKRSPVEDEVGILAAVGGEALHLEGPSAHLVARRAGTPFDADDPVGVDVGEWVGGGDAGDRLELAHVTSSGYRRWLPRWPPRPPFRDW